MSVTFFAVGAPSVLRVVDYGDGDVCEEEVSTLPEVNMSNTNASTIIALLGLKSRDGCGEVGGEQLDLAIRACTRVVNGADVSEGVREWSDSQGAMGRRGDEGGCAVIGRSARLIEVGLSDQGIRDWVSRVLGLLVRARAEGYEVAWA